MFPFSLFQRRGRLPAEAPRLPAGLRVYAVGDVHGCVAELDHLLQAIRDDAEATLAGGGRCQVVFLGDLIDRGPDSRGVIERILGGMPDGLAALALMGNHEAGLLRFLANPVAGARWLTAGGVETLASYGLRPSVGHADPQRLAALADRVMAAVPERHRRFLAGLPTWLERGDYAFVHAGVRPGRRLAAQRPEDLMAIRQPFLSSTRWHGRMIVHGHTVVEAPELLPNRIGIDTGAYHSGKLTAVVLEECMSHFISTG